jgi:drug/metabolite transporter (DMT)-like permease
MTTSSQVPQAATSRARRAAVLALLGVTLIWGCTFVWMEQALVAAERTLGPGHTLAGVGVFLTLRFGLGALLLAACVPAARRVDREAWKGGLVLGGLLLAGFVLQMLGLDAVSPAVSAFLTSLYVLFTAAMHARLERRGIGKALIVGAVLATAGAMLIRGPELGTADAASGSSATFRFQGELLTVACAFVFALHILATDRITRRTPALPVTVTSLAVVALGSALLLALDSLAAHGADVRGWWSLCRDREFVVPLLLSTVLATSLAIALMNVFQRALDPVRAAILYALEPIWAACAGLAYGTDSFTTWLLVGGALLVGGNLVAEIGSAARARGTPSRASGGTS